MGYKIYIPLYTQEGYYVDLEITEELMERIKASVELLESDPSIARLKAMSSTTSTAAAERRDDENLHRG